LTGKGHELKDVLNSLTDLALRWAEADAARPSTETLLPTD
jgi:hypothetical protein